MALDYLIKEPNTPATAAIIWMHGLGADAYDFCELPAQLQLPESLAIRFIFPHAPLRAVTLNGGYKMRAWYDLYGLEDHHRSQEDEAGLRLSQEAIEVLINAQIEAGMPTQRIMLGGFSQGGAMALFCGLRYPQNLGGILALSAYLPSASSLKQEARPENHTIPIFMAHGKNDAVVSVAWAEKSCAHLRELNYTVDWHSYPMEHQVCTQELSDMRQWLIKRL